MVNSHIILMSIKPKYAIQIINGQKRIELRRQRPNFNAGDLVVLYVSSPEKAVLGAFSVNRIISMPVETLWSKYNCHLGVERDAYEAYFAGCELAHGIQIKVVHLFQPVQLDELRHRFKNFSPPQSYMFWPDSWSIPEEWRTALIKGMNDMGISPPTTYEQLVLFV